MLPFGLCRPPPARNTEAQFIVSDRREKVNYDTGFVVPASLVTYSRLAPGGPVRQSYAMVDLISQSGSMNLNLTTGAVLY